MGKHGARELNYSSDIDLSSSTTPTRAPVARRPGAQHLLRALTRDLVELMAERTPTAMCSAPTCACAPIPARRRSRSRGCGAALLRDRRPELGAGGLHQGARRSPATSPAGEDFLRELAPYIWRKYLDFAAIADIHAIKRQIHAHKGHARVAVEGPQPEARARRHPRDRVLRPDPAADPGRAAAGAARQAARSTRWTAWPAREWIAAATARRAGRSLSLPAQPSSTGCR